MSSKKEALQRVILGFAPLADCHTPNLQTFLRRFARQNSVWKHWISQNRLELSRIVESSSIHKFNAYLEACESSLVSHLSLSVSFSWFGLLFWFFLGGAEPWLSSGRKAYRQTPSLLQGKSSRVAAVDCCWIVKLFLRVLFTHSSNTLNENWIRTRAEDSLDSNFVLSIQRLLRVAGFSIKKSKPAKESPWGHLTEDLTCWTCFFWQWFVCWFYIYPICYLWFPTCRKQSPLRRLKRTSLRLNE